MSDYLSHDEVEDAMPLSRREQFEWFQTNYNRMAPEEIRGAIEAHAKSIESHTF